MVAELENISVSFGGVMALKDATLRLKSGEVHALLGENGAGKSTLMNVLGGALTPDSGDIRIGGEPVMFKTPHDAIRRGVAVIHQEMALATDLTVAENIFLGRLPARINWRNMRRKAKALIERLGFEISPGATVSDLSVAHQQVVEIAKALSLNARVVVFDEPTAVLSTQDAERLLSVIRQLREDGVGVVYISHRLDEVFRIADRVTVLKDGVSIDTLNAAETSVNGVIELMVGRKLSAIFGEDVPREIGEVALKVNNLGAEGRVTPLSFELRRGEILGFGGLVGAGRTDLVRMIFGADRAQTGHIEVFGKEHRMRTPRAGVRAGLGLVPESRKDQGVLLDFPIRTNVTMPRLGPVTAPFGFIRFGAEAQTVDGLAKALRLKANSTKDPVSSLSGGNQQKVVLAKWIHAEGEILIFDEPTRGVDVGAKTEIYTLIRQMAAEGKAIIVISSEHHELFGLCDRVLVMREGTLTGALMPDEYSEANLLKLAMS